MRAGGTYLAMMIHGCLIHLDRAGHGALSRTPNTLIVENTRALRKHGSEINAFFTLPPCRGRYLPFETLSACSYYLHNSVPKAAGPML